MLISKKQPRRRNPLLLDTPEGQWNPAAAGVQGYPRTQDAFDAHKERLRKNAERARAAGKLSRRGIPNGWRGRRQEVEALRAAAADDGWKIAQVVCRNSTTPEEMLQVANERGVPATDDARAAVALAGIFGIALDPTVPVSLRLKAFRAALPFLVPMPRARRCEIKLTDGLAWLRSLAG